MVPPASILALADTAVAAPRHAPEPRPEPVGPRRDVSFQLSALHDRHADELLRFCRWMLRDPDDAADALQDTWIRAMSALSEDRVRVTAMRPWLYAIARNACLDRLRERKRSSNHELDESALGEGPAADEVAGLRNEARAALALIGTLSERQRSALLMREVAGMSVPEIADSLGVSVDRATWTIADARKTLEESDGRSLQCDVARDRLDRGARGRALRAHLSLCDECRAHDRAMRARRVLAPAILPFVWLRRVFAFLAPAAQPAAVAVVATTLALPHAHGPAVHRHVPAVAPHAIHTVVAPRIVARPAAVVAAPQRRRHAVGPASAVSRTVRHVHVTAATPPAARPAPAPAPAPVAAPPAPRPVHTVAAAVAKPVDRVLDSVDRTTASVPVAGPVVQRATGAVRQVVAGL